jgi:molybdenum cofactor cytidylyltransferase
MIAAIILAAGQSKRMGQNKMLLPFGRSTVIESIVTEVTACNLSEVVVVTGHEHEEIAALLANNPVRCVFNSDYDRSEMIVSIQAGLRALSEKIQAALIVLGDQPRIQRDMVQRIVAAYAPHALIIPSFQNRRAHPILVDRSLWADVLALPSTATLRDFVRSRADRIRYVEVDSDSVLHDMDTPGDYENLING